MKTQSSGRVYRTIIDYALGSGDRGLTLVGHDPSGRALEYRLSFYPDRVGWDVTTGQATEGDLPAERYAGRPMAVDEVRTCLNCHNTNAHAVLTKTGPESFDHAIGCERCHGPGGNHVLAVSGKSVGEDYAGGVDLAIARPAAAQGAAVVGLCAMPCLSNRECGPRPDAAASVRFQASTLVKSRCYTQSGQKLDCVTCHDPHQGAETSPKWYESRCIACHSSAGTGGRHADRPDAVHAMSCPVSPSRGCIDCHMPRRASMTAHTTFADHFIRIHPEIKSRTGAAP